MSLHKSTTHYFIPTQMEIDHINKLIAMHCPPSATIDTISMIDEWDVVDLTFRDNLASKNYSGGSLTEHDYQFAAKLVSPARAIIGSQHTHTHTYINDTLGFYLLIVVLFTYNPCSRIYCEQLGCTS